MNIERELFLFVSTGDLTRMYTLRVMCECSVSINGGSRLITKDYYIKNLSTDSATANAKALIESERMDLPLKGSADFDLEEIRRRNAEEMAEIRERVEREEREKIDATMLEIAAALDERVILIGKYTGFTPEEVVERYDDADYLEWLASNHVERGEESIIFDKFLLSAELAHNYLEANPLPKSEWVGVVGEPIEIEVKIKYSGWTRGQFPTVIFGMVDRNGNIIKAFSKAKSMMDAPEGEWITIKGKVKDHDESHYDDWKKATIIKAPKVVK